MTTCVHRWDAPPRGSGVTAPDIVALVAGACRRDPDQPAIVFEDGVSITRGELRAAIERFGGALRERISAGDRVAIMLENRIEFMVAWVAVVANGGVLVSMNPSAGDYDASHVLRDSGAVLAITGRRGRALLEGLRDTAPDLREVLEVSGTEPHGLDRYAGGTPLDLDAATIDPGAATNVYYTSGTTGPPKGCLLGHDYWLRFVDLWLRLYGMEPGDRLLCCLQFFYGDPPWQFLTSLHAGCPWIVMRRFSVSRFWDVVRANDVTLLFGLASIPGLLMKAPPSPSDRDHRVRFAVQIGVPTCLHAELVARWGFPWLEGYGLTETGLVVSMPLDEAATMTGSGSIGRPCPEVEVRLLDGRGHEAPPGEPGEIVVRAPGMMQGYLGRPDATAATMQGGWLHTGDLARRDGAGHLFFLGRTKDIIRRSGENVAASEVEALLTAHPKVLEAAVLAVPDDLRGEEVKAVIALVDGAGPDAVPPDEIVGFCAGRLARYKVPRYVEYREEPFPRTPSMRIRKAELAAAAARGPGDAWDRERELGW